MALASWLLTALVAAATTPVQAYFLMGANNPLTTERIDPIVNSNDIAGHVHTVFGGSNFRLSTNTSYLRQSECSSVPIVQDKSNYWVPTMYFQWKNGSFTSVNGGAVIYYLFDDKAGVTTAFPDDFRMLSGDPLLRTYDANSYAQQAITFLCLDFNGVTTRHNELPRGKKCPSGIRAQVNFPMCWDGKNTDSPDHKSHVAFPSGGPDSGSCKDPKYPVTLPRVFMEMYWGTPDFKDLWNDAMDTEQPFVFSNGDPTGYGYHGDFINGWDSGVLQKVVDTCHCDPNGSLDCCAQQGVFTLNKDRHCRITKAIDETTTGTLPKLPGNNPVTAADGARGNFVPDNTRPQLLSPIYVYYGDQPDKVGTPVAGSGGQTNGESGAGSGSNGQTTTTQATSATTPTQSTSQGSEGSSSTESSVPPASPTGSQGSGSESGSNNGSNNSSGGSGSQGSEQQGGYPPTSPPVSSGSDNGNNNNNGGSASQGSQQEGTNPPTSPPVSSGTNNNSGGNTSGQATTSSPATPPVSSGSGSSNQHHGGGYGYGHGHGSSQNSGSGSGTEAHTGGKGADSHSNSSHSNSGSGSSGGSKTCGRKYRKRSTTTTSSKKRSAGFHRRRHSNGFEFNQF